VEGDHPKGVRMTLSGQVFTLMGGVATDDQAQEMIRAADKYLLDPEIGGYRLNTNFGEVLLNLGRAFGYAFGHKENGAMFSHMAVMYANALYQRGFVQEGYLVLDGIYRQSTNFPLSRMYPGIPEYFNNRGRGMYPYLTGSASWYLLTLVTEAFGIKGHLGDLEISPKLVRAQFDPQGIASVITLFSNRKVKITIQNPERLDYGEYQIDAIKLAGARKPFERAGYGAILARQDIEKLSSDETHSIEVILVRRD
jgi:cellobiose phosphorylase